MASSPRPTTPLPPPTRRRIIAGSSPFKISGRRFVLAVMAVYLAYLGFHRAKLVSTMTTSPRVSDDDDVVDNVVLGNKQVADPPREELEEDDTQPDFPEDSRVSSSTIGVVEEMDDQTLAKWSMKDAQSSPPTTTTYYGQSSYVWESHSDNDWNTLVHEAVRDTTKLTMDVYFHRLTDSYGLIDLRYPESDLIKMFERIVQIWAQANIHVRFWLPESLQLEPLARGASEAYKIYVTGNKEENSPELVREKTWLTNTAFGKEKTDWMYAQMLAFRPNSCCSIEKMLVGSVARTRWQKRNTISFYPMHYLRWYNGFSLDRMVVIRGGSCWTPENKMLDGAPVVCRLGYKDGIGPLKRRNPNSTDFSGARDWERFPFTWKQFARIAAHEIGHYVGLGHWNGGRCTKWNTIEEANLMSQQKRVAIPGSPCGMQNRFSEDAIFLSKDQIATARSLVKRMDAREVPLPQQIVGNAIVQRMGQSMEQETESRAKPDLQHGLVLMDTAPCNGRVRRVRFKFHMSVGEDGAATDPSKNAHFMVFSSTMASDHKTRVNIRDTAMIELSTKPYSYQRHLSADCDFKVVRGDIIGVAPVLNQRDFPISMASKSDVVSTSYFFRRIKNARYVRGVLKVELDGSTDTSDAGLAPFFGLDVVCDG